MIFPTLFVTSISRHPFHPVTKTKLAIKDKLVIYTNFLIVNEYKGNPHIGDKTNIKKKSVNITPLTNRS